MRCISPFTIRSSGKHNLVPCGKCNFCLSVKRADWSFRLLNEHRHSTSAHFLTLTYSDDQLPTNGLDKNHCQNFMKRLRKDNSKKIRFYTVGEYGTVTQRAHYHSIIFNLDVQILNKLSDIWSHGAVHVGTVTAQSIHYVTKYVINRVADFGDRAPPFSLMSRRPGIGYRYLDTHTLWHQAIFRSYTKVNGIVARLPRYYKDKIFTPTQRERLAAEAIAKSDIDYWLEIDRLSNFNDGPQLYYDEAIYSDHDSIRTKINSQNKF